MSNKELIQNIQKNYDVAKQIAKDVWIATDAEGNNNDYYYFECGFIAGLVHNLDGSLKTNDSPEPTRSSTT